jgi:hypothetical protein
MRILEFSQMSYKSCNFIMTLSNGKLKNLKSKRQFIYYAVIGAYMIRVKFV